MAKFVATFFDTISDMPQVWSSGETPEKAEAEALKLLEYFKSKKAQLNHPLGSCEYKIKVEQIS